MDYLDRVIIDVLQSDGRVSNAGIARYAGVSEGTVRRRLRRLIDEDLIKVLVIADPKGLGRSYQSIVGISVDPDRVDAVLDQVCELEEVTFAASTTGGFDLMVCVGVETSDALGRFLTDRLGAIPGVRRTETHVVLTVGKDGLGRFT